ncbi:hypothetical protein SAMN02746062_00842 [Alysiella filiformis DSM 16848]|uniref:Uncharacterized protein n=1 Tax=Alysiella filiformis DSM 16848 TaxID=1120981 RepID=A0A286E8I2_9NEIS|nr:hypothetical protein SAMN02746062_00842 [Alysiella filiformis DSM 16848]
MTIWARSWFFRQNRQIQGKNARQCHPLARIFDAEVGDFDEKTIAKRIVISPYQQAQMCEPRFAKFQAA